MSLNNMWIGTKILLAAITVPAVSFVNNSDHTICLQCVVSSLNNTVDAAIVRWSYALHTVQKKCRQNTWTQYRITNRDVLIANSVRGFSQPIGHVKCMLDLIWIDSRFRHIEVGIVLSGTNDIFLWKIKTSWSRRTLITECPYCADSESHVSRIEFLARDG